MQIKIFYSCFFIVFCFILSGCPAGHAIVSAPNNQLNQEQFTNALFESDGSLHAIIQRISTSPAREHAGFALRKIDSLRSEFKIYKSISTQYKLEYSIAKLAADWDIMINITFITKDSGASIKYMSLLDKSPTPCDRLTNNCIGNSPIGKCIFWSERKGNRTSQVYKKIFMEDGTFEIVEDQK